MKRQKVSDNVFLFSRNNHASIVDEIESNDEDDDTSIVLSQERSPTLTAVAGGSAPRAVRSDNDRVTPSASPLAERVQSNAIHSSFSHRIDSDPIGLFTDDDQSGFHPGDDSSSGEDWPLPENILDGLDDWTASSIGEGSRPMTSPARTDTTDPILSQSLTDPWPASPVRRSDHVPPRVFSPRFRPNITTDISLRPDHVLGEREPEDRSLDLTPGGIAEKALEIISREKQEYIEWERVVRAEMAKCGSTVKATRQFNDTKLLRILHIWQERGHILAQCVALRPQEIALIRHSSSLQSQSQTPSNTGNNDVDDIEEDFSQPASLPPYVPKEDDKIYHVLFSFTYMKITNDAKDSFLRDKVVAIWPPWSVVSWIADGKKMDAVVVTRFMADSIY